LPLFAGVGLRLNLFPKQNHALVRKSLWICLPPYFSARDIAPGLFFSATDGATQASVIERSRNDLISRPEAWSRVTSLMGQTIMV
jgi:hypothetical protein